ncbi:DUF2798 domain-containing protein [Paenibacillus segetis]|uniref:DUF2798 domain-containing protein n=1 Tax=Paenibacillus segetis TaxID=1325360 RepID=A0ABQ1Y9G5_9BACL|nr:DUF2798 domain-containing protein [Paenibacillus segetis]GGH16343.1 DUF2798 domain-containing protein [Paenibacillus segetis]
MGKNKKEDFVFTLMMCALMVLGMSIYNVILIKGFSSEVIKDVLIGYIPTLVVALLLEIFVVGKVAKGIVHKMMRDNDPLFKRIILTSLLMVCGMVLFMSFYGAVTHLGFSSGLPGAYISNIGKNFIFALPLQLLIVGPIARLLFSRMYPVKIASASSV